MNIKIKVPILSVLFLLSSTLYGQRTEVVCDDMNDAITYANSRPDVSFDYKSSKEWKKYRRLKALGWTTFGVGGAMVAIGGVADFIDNYEVHKGENRKTRFRIMWCIGAGVALSSIPLFICAHKNKKKALSVNVTAQTVFMPMQMEQQPAIALRFSF